MRQPGPFAHGRPAVAVTVDANACGHVADSSADPAPSPTTAAACRLAKPVGIVLPSSLADHHGSVSGLSPSGELLVTETRGAAGADRLSVFDPGSRLVTPVVSRDPIKSADTATTLRRLRAVP